MRALRRFNDQRGYPLWLIGGRRSTFDICGDGGVDYGRPFICAMTFPRARFRIKRNSFTFGDLFNAFGASKFEPERRQTVRAMRNDGPNFPAALFAPHV